MTTTRMSRRARARARTRRRSVHLSLLTIALILAAVVPVLTVGADSHELMVSQSPDRSPTFALQGAELTGNAHVFLPDASDITQVRFSIDGNGPVQTEKKAPWDLAGTAGDGTALAYDTTQLPDGVHSVTAVVGSKDGKDATLTASFTVANDAAEPTASPSPSDTEPQPEPEEDGTAGAETPELVVSTSADRSNSVPLTGHEVSGDAYVSLPDTPDADDVVFLLDGDRVQKENNAPWDFAGGDVDRAHTWDTTSVADGSHTITAVVITNGQQAQTTATFTVDNASDTQEPEPAPETEAPELVVSTSADRSNSVPLTGREVSGDAYVSLPDTPDADDVVFLLDGDRVQKENNAPWDFAGGDVDRAHTWDTTSVADGSHTITAVVITNGQQAETTATFTVDNASETQEPDPTPTASESAPETDGDQTPDAGDMPSRSSIIAGAGLSNPSALKVVDGFDITTDGAVIEDLDIRGAVNVKADNVTFRNVKFTYEGNSFAVRIYDEHHGTSFEHCEFDVIAGNAGIRGGSGRTVRHCEFHGSADGVKIHRDELYEYNYIHMSRRPGSDKHLDGMQNSGHGSNVVIRHNVIDQPADVGSNAAIFTQAKFDNPDDILITQNYLNGGNYTLYVKGQERTTNVRIIGNRFGRDYRYGVETSTSPDMVWQDNVWDDTGKIIPD